MNKLECDFLIAFLQEKSGLALTGDKTYLIESRLLPIARRHKLDTLEALIHKLHQGRNPALETEIVEAMATHETFFFRDKAPFEAFTEIMLPSLLQARRNEKTLRIWSAACSTGQEPYSLAMLLKEKQAQLAGWRIEILATDLSDAILKTAQAATYTQFDVQRGLPIQLLVKYFDQVGDMWQVKPEIKAMVRFRQCNLLHEFAMLGTFDVIFCRNVLIYFNNLNKIKVLNRMAKQLRSDGYLMLGAAETMIGLTDNFATHPQKRGLYQPMQKISVAAKTPIAAIR